MGKGGLVKSIGLVVLLLICCSDGVAQYCVGGTRYAPRNEKGRLINKRSLNKLTILEIDGKKREIVRKDKDEYSYFYATTDGKNRSHALEFKKSLVFFFGYCNQIRDLTLKYKNKTMKLIFDIGILNTNLDISALRFQNGTFKLTSIACADGESPPRIDNENRGFCKVDARHWKKISPDIVEIEDECCEKRPRFGHGN